MKATFFNCIRIECIGIDETEYLKIIKKYANKAEVIYILAYTSGKDIIVKYPINVYLDNALQRLKTEREEIFSNIKREVDKIILNDTQSVSLVHIPMVTDIKDNVYHLKEN